MNSFISITKNDFKLIFRDKTLLIMFILPFIFIVICRFLVPLLSSSVIQIQDYYWLIAAVFCVLSGSTPAFLTAFIMLDEKDEQIIPALKVLPTPYAKITTYRILFLMMISFFSTLIFLLFNNLTPINFGQIILTSILVCFIPALLLLLIIPFAKNKIEGVTLFKGVNIILFIPIAGFFILPQLKYLFGILPFFWAYELLNNSNNLYLDFIIGLVLNGGYIYLLSLFFRKRYMTKF